MEIYSKPEVDALLERIWQVVGPMLLDVADIKGQLPRWVPLEEAMRLTGRSETWFREQRNRYKLPIAYLPKAEGSSRLMYDREDCIKYGRDRGIHPPVHVAWMPLVEKLTSTTQDGSSK